MRVWIPAALSIVQFVLMGICFAEQTVKVAYTPQILERHYFGTVEAINQATVSAQTTGQVAKMNFDVGDKVPKGNVIIELVDQEQQAIVDRAQSALLAAQADVARAQPELQRIETLFHKNVTTQQQLDQAKNLYEKAQSNVKQAQADLKLAQQNLSYTLIRAPYSGIVTMRHTEVGELVQPGSRLMSGFSMRELRVNVQIAQSDLENVKRFLHVEFMDQNGKRYPTGKITVFPYADPYTHTVLVRANISEKIPNIIPGMAIKVAFQLGEIKRMMIPNSAIMTRSELTGVYVLRKDKSIELRQIRTGISRGELTEVISGLQQGETIFIDSQQAAQLRSQRS